MVGKGDARTSLPLWPLEIAQTNGDGERGKEGSFQSVQSFSLPEREEEGKAHFNYCATILLYNHSWRYHSIGEPVQCYHSTTNVLTLLRYLFSFDRVSRMHFQDSQRKIRPNLLSLFNLTQRKRHPRPHTASNYFLSLSLFLSRSLSLLVVPVIVRSLGPK